MMASNHLEKLSTDYLTLLDDKDDFNVIINVGESLNTKTFRAHSNILRHRSSYFHNKLASTSKTQNNVKTINLKHVSAQQFDVIIKYIYGGAILLENDDTTFIFKLMLIACEFFLEELAKHFEDYLINTNDHWLRLNFTRIYQTIFQNNTLQKLQNWCNDIIVKYPNNVFDSTEFTSLPENALVSLIRRDDLQIEEVKIWNYIIKWGIAQNSGLPSDLKHWSHENFSSLRITLQNCLPYIRYFQISADDIVDNIEPYQSILDRDLWRDIMRRITNPNRPISTRILPPRIILTPTSPSKKLENQIKFSIIINEEHAAELASWIDKKEDIYSIINNPYDFKLLLRGTRDGFTAESFWNLCDKQANTILIMKVKGTNEILGGYNPIQWDISAGTQSCNESFIFSLKNGDIQSSTLSRINFSQDAIYSDPDYGPCFDDDLSMKNNFNQHNQCWCYHYSYEKPIRYINEYYFSISEYEIFQIQKKCHN